jgi:hypothetical protein
MPNINTVLDQHVELKCECVDRLFLNGYVSRLQDPPGLSYFLCQHRGEQIPRYEVLGEMTRNFKRDVGVFAEKCGIPVIEFERRAPKEDIVAPYFEKATREGVVLIGTAQERANVFRAPARGQREVGKFAATRNSAFVNSYYFYILDQDFGRSFIKICSYAPFGIRVWLNGHHWVKQQLRHRGIDFEPLDNGIASVADPAALQRTCDRLSAAHVQRFFDRWLYRLPNPFTRKDRAAGYTHELSILQIEVSRTEIFDRPLHGRQFFEEVIRDNLDLGRPEKLQLIFDKRIPKGVGMTSHRTRVFCQGVDPSLHVEHRNTTVKQYWKCDRALRTETTFNDTYDFGIGRSLKNLGDLVAKGKDINRRLLTMERAAQHCTPAATVFQNLVLPTGDPDHRAPGLRFGDPRVVGIFGALSQFNWVMHGFRARDLRPLVEHHLTRPYTMGQMAYDLRRLRRKGIIERIPLTHLYQLTRLGRQLAFFCTKLYSRVVCRGIAKLHPEQLPNPVRNAWNRFDEKLDGLIEDARLTA